MSSARRRISHEFKDELCREVNESSRPIKSVATECGAGSEKLRN
jgi:transposase